MDANSVVDLEREVEEFLLIWSSCTPDEEEKVRHDSGVLATPPPVNTPPRTRVMAGRAAPSPSEVSVEHQVQRRPRAVGLRHIGQQCEPYRVGQHHLRRPTLHRGYSGFYIAELKATWPARYWKLKGSMDRIWNRP